MRRILLAGAAALPLARLSAQQLGSIRGVVQDADFGAPLPSVQVHAVELGQQALTQEQGSYVFRQVPPGKYTLVFAKEGYVRQVKADVVVNPGELSEVDVALAGDFTEMEEFVVQDALRLAPGTETSLLALRLESPTLMDSVGADFISRAGVSDAASALRLVAGASVQDGKSAVVRGLPDRYVSSQMNGVRLPTADEDKRAVELDQFPAAVIESIRVSKTFLPDQLGDASGGAVNLRLKGVPEEPFFFEFRTQVSNNTQVTGKGQFLRYDGGGAHFWGRDDGDRDIQHDNIGDNWDGAVGVSRGEAPIDAKWSLSMGGSHVLDSGIKIGGFFSFFHERDSGFFDNGIDDSWWVEAPGAPMTPKASQGTVGDGDFKTSLFDVVQGKQSVQWGSLSTLGGKTENHALTLVHLYTRTAEDTATLAEDTRGKAYFFPGHDPDDQRTPGHDRLDAAPYLRLETLEYNERTTETLQLTGWHRFQLADNGLLHEPELDWTLAKSSADLYQPDKRQFGSLWVPGRRVGTVVVPPTHRGYKPSANFTLGNLQRIWKTIDEDSEQYFTNIKLPYQGWTDTEGYFKFGWFADKVDRRFNQDTFSNFGDNTTFTGEFTDFWSRRFPRDDHPITESTFDVDYRGEQKVSAYYGMLDLPLLANLNLVGGVRVETTEIGIVNDPEADATWFPPGSLAPTRLNPGDADVNFKEDEILPALGLIYTPFRAVTVRASYNKTLARQTFKELTPILQQEYLGGPIFIGNPDLQLGGLRNYDVRIDYEPYAGGLFSASWFRKDVRSPIEYVQRVATFDFTTAVNYPRGKLTGWELETRHDLGHFLDVLGGLAVGANATLIQSEVMLPDDEAAEFEAPNIGAPMRSRDMAFAPESLTNLFLTYATERTGTELAMFYTIQGDTLVAGAGQSNGNYVPNVYADDFDTLNFSIGQRLSKFVKLQFHAKNLTNPRIREVYRSDYIGEDVTKTSYTQGVEYAVTIGGKFVF
jgi:hypothetical protein